jgi:hypothetical protein
VAYPRVIASLCVEMALAAACRHAPPARPVLAVPVPMAALPPVSVATDQRVRLPQGDDVPPSEEEFNRCVIGPALPPMEVVGRAPAGNLWITTVSTDSRIRYGPLALVRIDTGALVRTDSFGRLQIRGLSPGRHTLQVLAIGVWPRRDTFALKPRAGVHLRVALILNSEQDCLWMYK